MNISVDKKRLREQVLAIRRDLSADEIAMQSEQLTEKFFALPSWQAADTVGLFASAPDEVTTDGIIQQALKTGKCVVLSRVAAPGELCWHEIFSMEQLVKGSFGIREPRADLPMVELAAIDFLLVPGVAFDTEGNRLGYGGGFYDRVLADFVGDTVSLALDCQLVKKVPTDEWDQSVDLVIS